MTTPNLNPTAIDTKIMLEELPLLLQKDIEIRKADSHNDAVYTSKVLKIENNRLQITLPRCLPDFGYLRDSCGVVIAFVLENILFEAAAAFIADNNHQLEIVIDEQIVTANRRGNERLPLAIETVYVPISDLSLTSGQLSNLKWRRGQTFDVSGGGILLSIPMQAPINSYFLLNLDIDSFEGPLFVFSQLRWLEKSEAANSNYQCGFQFLNTEHLAEHFSKRALSGMPPLMLGFTRKKQMEFENYLIGVYKNSKGEK
ncbi:MAG: PilZ domain-containing protein [candidate division Zixibacteria bacterium]|nr:PilZ domain-containing protein [candidate division Zixibacteria bacterium]